MAAKFTTVAQVVPLVKTNSNGTYLEYAPLPYCLPPSTHTHTP